MTRQQRIEQQLQQLSPLHLDVLNESHGHNVPPNSETHFKLVIVAREFSGLSPVKRHQRVYALLQNELDSGLHALAMHLYSPDEWQGNSPDSPACMGGSKK